MTWSLVSLVVLSQVYVRSRIDDADSASQCLWWHEDTALVMKQSVNGNPENRGAEFSAIGSAITTWQTQLNTCSSLSMTDGPRTQSRKVGYFGTDDENITVFRLKKCADVVPLGAACRTDKNGNCGNDYDCWDHTAGAIAITTTSFDPDTGRILDSDIEFNTPSFLFTTVDTPPCLAGQTNLNCVATDVQNATTHELGHVLGLAHSPSVGSTMAAKASVGETTKRTLDSATAQFVCDVYPRGGIARTCVVKPVDETLGKVSGCSTTGLAAWGLVAVLLRRRRRA